MSDKIKQVHLGSGAYATAKHGGITFTANHHDEALATDIVWLDEYALRELKSFIAELEEAK